MNLKKAGTVSENANYINKFYHLSDYTRIDFSYTLDVYIQVTEECNSEITIRGIQFSSDNNICVAWNRRELKSDLEEAIEITKEEYNTKILEGNIQIEKLLA